MTRLFIAAALALGAGLVAVPASAAGLSFIEVPMEGAAPMAGAVWYPCATPPGEVPVGKQTLPGAKDCPVAGDHLPLVVMSHGNGGNFAGHHDTAEALADAGFIVAAINHPGDSGWSPDQSRKYTLAALTDRPADIKRLVDFMLGAWTGAAKIDPDRIGFFGFSRGGFTGLSLIGGEIDWRGSLPKLCPPESTIPACVEARKQSLAGEPLPEIHLAHDPRIKAAVIADPLLGAFFTPDSLKTARASVQLWGSEQGGDGVHPEDAATAARNLPGSPEYHQVAKAAHFAFLPPCGAQLTQARPDICTDAAGFDRTAFHAQFNEQVVAFLRAHLVPHS